MFSRALLAGAVTALALTVPVTVSGAGVVDVGADKVPTCPVNVSSAMDLDLTLAVLTPGDSCAQVQQTAYEMTPTQAAPVTAPAPVATQEPTLVASNGDTVVDKSVQLVIPFPRLVRSTSVPLFRAPVRQTPALTASLPKPAPSEGPKFTSDALWMIGVYR